MVLHSSSVFEKKGAVNLLSKCVKQHLVYIYIYTYTYISYSDFSKGLSSLFKGTVSMFRTIVNPAARVF